MVRLSVTVTPPSMTPQDLRAHKGAPKALGQIPSFKPIKKGTLPAPFNRHKSKRLQSTGMIEVSSEYAAIFIWRDGPILTDRSFYGHLFEKHKNGKLNPVFEFHWHPNHRGFHCKLPCRTNQDYTDRLLPGAPELAIKTNSSLDPGSQSDRNKLIELFCKSCGISLPSSDPKSMPLFT